MYYELPIPTSTKSLVIGVDNNLVSGLDISLTGETANLVKNYLTNNNYLLNKNLPIQGDDNIVVVIRNLPGSTKGQVAPNTITESALNILYLDIDMFRTGADPALTAGTIVHELQHLINYAYDPTGNFSSLNEGLSSYFESDFHTKAGNPVYTTDREYQFTNVENNQYNKSLYRVDSYE